MPKGRWQSPTMQAVRALLIVNNEDLRIRVLDGDGFPAKCVMRDGVREYYLRRGPHTITATFSYDVPPSEGFLGAVKGQPLTVTHEFETEHAYVALYQEHPYPRPVGEGIAEVASNVHREYEQYYWTLEIVDLAEATFRREPDVENARLYCDWVTEIADASN
jgi:hypothetical protein